MKRMQPTCPSGSDNPQGCPTGTALVGRNDPMRSVLITYQRAFIVLRYLRCRGTLAAPDWPVVLISLSFIGHLEGTLIKAGSAR